MTPALAVQKAVRLALANVAGGRVYDRVPLPITWPFVRIGEDDLQADHEFGDFWRVTVKVTAHSQAVGKPEVKSIVGEIATALMTDLALDGWAIIESDEPLIRFFTAPDGKSEQGAFQIEYLIQP